MDGLFFIIIFAKYKFKKKIMKKIYFLLFILLTITFSYSQETLINGGLEAWTSGDPDSWTKSESATQESVAANVHGGTSSAKVIAGSTRDLTQNVSVIPGESYTLSVWYKVETGDGTDARVWSYWLNGTSTVTDAATDGQLRTGYFDEAVWTNYTTTVTAPATGVDGFRFEVRTYNGATVYWDDLSFINNQTLSIDQPEVLTFSIFPNPTSNGFVTIKSQNTTATTTVSVFDVLGKEVINTVLNSDRLNVSNLNAGVYILKLNQNGATTTKKLVIK